MAKNFKDFSDKKFFCQKCKRHLADEKIDRQLLVFGKIAAFNFLRFACLFCGSPNKWQSVNLSKAERLEEFPDSANDTPEPNQEILELLRTI